MSNIKTEIDANIHSNMATPITGGVLNGVLNDMVDDYDEKVGDIALKTDSFLSLVASLFADAVFTADRSEDIIRLQGYCGTARCGFALCGYSVLNKN